MTATRLHVLMMDATENLIDTLERAMSPDSDGGTAITALEAMAIATIARREALPLITEASDTLRIIGVAAGAGVQSAWLGRQIRELAADTAHLALAGE